MVHLLPCICAANGPSTALYLPLCAANGPSIAFYSGDKSSSFPFGIGYTYDILQSCPINSFNDLDQLCSKSHFPPWIMVNMGVLLEVESHMNLSLYIRIIFSVWLRGTKPALFQQCNHQLHLTEHHGFRNTLAHLQMVSINPVWPINK